MRAHGGRRAEYEMLRPEEERGPAVTSRVIVGGKEGIREKSSHDALIPRHQDLNTNTIGIM